MKWLSALIAVICFCLDLIFKSWAKTNLVIGISKPFIPRLIELNLTTNTGCAFGIARQSGWIMTVVAVSVLIGVLIWSHKRERSNSPLAKLEWIGLGFLVGGAMGNIIERLIYGKVTDFLSFMFIDFPVFNVADMCIDIGAALILWQLWPKASSTKLK